MPVTAIGDASPKSHKKSRSADSNAKDVGQEHVKSKKRKHKEATTLKGQAASTTGDSQSASHPLSPSSAPSTGNVASKNVQLANLTTGDAERKKKNKNYLGNVAHEQLKDRSDERRKEKTKKKLKHSDEGQDEGVALDGQVTHSNDTKVRTPEEATSEKSRQKKRKAQEQSGETPDSKPLKKKKGHRPPDLPSIDPSADESLSDQSRKALSYAYARFEDPPNWKFNKARQIWLIKRLWSEEMVRYPRSILPW